MFKSHSFSLYGIVAGVALAAFGVSAYAHMHSEGHHGQAGAGLTSLAGSPADLAERALQLGRHVCAQIESGASCALMPLAATAAADLHSEQAAYSSAMAELHSALLAAEFDRPGLDRLRERQADMLKAASLRYSQFLVDSAQALTPAQKAQFAHPKGGKP